jgi:hypothetical protein
MSAAQPVRRIITGQRASGESVFAIDEEVEPHVHPASTYTYWPIWGRDEVTQLPYDVPDYVPTMFPSTAAGFRAHVVEFPPKGGPFPEPRGQMPPRGLAEGTYVDPDTQGMHWTDTVDIVIVLEGEIGLVQGDGSEVRLTPGTVLVQNGAMHAWRPGDVACRMCFVNLGAQRTAAPSAEPTS